MYYEFGWPPYVSVAERKRKAAKEMEKLKKKGQTVSPVVIKGRTIAATFWGKAWCDNLEAYSDYENRLPRGRAYVRNGSVLDLQIGGGEVKAMVSGSHIYKVALKVKPVSKARWRSICADCAGAIDSLVELLQGRFSKGVMERLCRQGTGLFPTPDEIHLSCSCPDGAWMCKHIAAVLYGVGARLDEHPELLFKLHLVDEKELIANAAGGLALSGKAPGAEKTLAGDDLSAIFGLEMAQNPELAPAAPVRPAKPERAKKSAVEKPKPSVRAGKKAKKRKPAKAERSSVQAKSSRGSKRRT